MSLYSVPPNRTHLPMYPYPAPSQIPSSFPPTHPFPATSQPYPYPLPYPEMPPYLPYVMPSQIYSSHPPMYPPPSLPSQMDSSSSYSSSLPSGKPSEAPEEPSEVEREDPDKSEALFAMYLERSDEDDRKTTERWKGESEAILIFTGLFSAALAALLSVSVQGLQLNSQDTSAFYLGNIYHVLANSTTSQPIIPPTLSDPPKFSPPKSAVLVNSLWFLSLVMSLTGALIAVFIQQWAQTYLEATQGRHSPKVRARIRTFYAEGLDKLYLHRVTRAVPILIHVSLFLFFSGLPIFLFNVNRTVFNVVVAWLAFCVAGYACITLMPIIRQDSPYYSPLSSSTWWCVINTLFILYRLFKIFMPRNSFLLRWYHIHYSKSHFRWPTLRAMQKAGELFAQKLPSDIDYRALSWMFKTLNDDDEFEEFFDALPSLCDSEELEDAQRDFIQPNEKMLSRALTGMMDRTLLSELAPESVKQRRIIICTKVIGATFLLDPSWTLPRVLFGDWIGFSRSIHFGLFVQNWENISDPVTAFYAQYAVAITLASVQERDDRWFELASGQLNESKSFLRSCYAIGDSILLANAIFIIRRTIQTFCGSRNHHQRDADIFEASSKTLELICRFDIQNTLSEHQHVFCSLWNQLVDEAQNNPNPQVTSICVVILKSIRRLYLALHRKTDTSVYAGSYSAGTVLRQAGSYPRCDTDEHYPSTMVPRLPLYELPIYSRQVSMDVIRDLTSMLVPTLPPTYSTPYPTVIPNPYNTVSLGSSPTPTAIPTISSRQLHTQSMYYGSVPPSPYNPLAPGRYPLFPDQYSYSASAAPPGVSPFVPISQMASSRSRRRLDEPATTAEADSRLGDHVPHTPTPFIPKVLRRKKVEFVGVSSASTSRPSSPASPVHLVPVPALPERQEPPVISPGADIPISTSALTTSTPFIPPKVAMPETPFLPPLSGPGPFSVPQGPPVVTHKHRSPTPTKSQVVSSSLSRDGGVQYIPPVAGPSRLNTAIPPQICQPFPTRPSDISTPIQVPLDNDSMHSTTDLSFATALSTPSSPVPFDAPLTGENRRGDPAQAPLAVPSVIEFNEYGEFSGLLYYSPHCVLYEDELYPTALHLFEALKFLPFLPYLADRVRQCERVEQVASISAEMTNFVRHDWGNIMLSMMDAVLYLKFRQHSALRNLLFSTYQAELVYVEPRDLFWGGGGAGAGRNEFGKSLMRVRERLRIEAGM